MEYSKKIFRFQVFSFLFIAIVGTLLHFTYSWSGNNFFVASFSAVNESTWEHLKLIFFPSLIITVIGFFIIGKNISNFLYARVVAVIASMIFIVVFFYTYTGVLETNVAILDIGSFFVAVFLEEYLVYRIIKKKSNKNTNVSSIILIILLLCFITFTYFPPMIGLFKDPLNNSYGIYGYEKNNVI